MWTLLKRWKLLYHQRQAMCWMLQRSDDHWLNDIGMTRDEVRKLLNKWE